MTASTPEDARPDEWARLLKREWEARGALPSRDLFVASHAHCPRTVIATSVRAAFDALQPGGQLRLSVLAFHDDPEGIVGPQDEVRKATEVLANDMAAVIASLTPEERRLAFDTYYMGDRFRYAELAPFQHELTGGTVALYRGDPGCIYAAVTRPA